MVFSSMVFLLFFLPCLLLLYYIVPKRLRGLRNLVLLVFSLFFYAYGAPRLLLLLTASIAINYCCALLCAPEHVPAVRKAGLLAACVLGLALLGWFKYAGFFAQTLNALGLSLPVPEIVLPIGISFFTFQGLSYVIDVYRGDARVQKNPLSVALYEALFPQLVAGPIVRYTTVEADIAGREESLSDFSAGAVRFLVGLGKKMLLANAMASVADGVYAHPASELGAALSWVGAIAYTFQIYFDFSGYSDMAIGLGRMFGFHFLENFDYPYIARSVTEFWRRWHISLSTWFRDYVYIPLGGSRCAKWKRVRNIVVVWLLTGLWHGANWTFVVWGAWFCLLLLGEKYVWGAALSRAPTAGHLLTLLCVVVSWVFFRAPTLAYSFAFLGAMAGFGASAGSGEAAYYLLEYWPEFLLCALACLPLKRAAQTFLERRVQRPLAAALLVWSPKVFSLALLALSYVKLVSGSFNPFIYFQF